MAPPQWAYQADNFEPPPDEELLCSICTAVFCEPVQCPCNHVFCRLCITKWLQSNHNCPVCRKRVTKYSLQEVVPLVKNMIMKLTLHCHNSDHGCEDKITLEGCETHLKSCKFEMVQCKNKPCKQRLFRKDIGDHECNGCPHRFVKCTNCNLKISSISPDQHNCVKELVSLVKRKNIIIKKKIRCIKDLEEEIKKLKEAERSQQNDFSDISYGSYSSTDFAINWRSGSSSDPSTEFLDDNISVTEDENEDLYNQDDNHAIMDDMERSADDGSVIDLGSTGEREGANTTDSIELPRSLNLVNDMDTSNGTSSFSREFRCAVSEVSPTSFEEMPQPRRPVKRRHTPTLQSLISDPSENEDDSSFSHLLSLPSTKKCWSSDALANSTWSPLQQTLESTGDDMSLNQESNNLTTGEQNFIPSPIGPSSSSCTASGIQMNLRSHSSLRNKYRRSSADSKAQRRGLLPETDSNLGHASVPQSSFNQGTFERTLALLDQYNLESDPEWFPCQLEERRAKSSSDSDDNTSRSFFIASHSSSEDSSLSDTESDASSIEDVPVPMSVLIQRECADSSDDPDWLPQQI